MGIEINQKLDKLLSSSHEDGRSFKNVLISLDLLKKKENSTVTLKKSASYSNRYARYKKSLATPKATNSENDPNYHLKNFSSQLLKRIITPDQFRQVLRENGINPMIEGINKVVRDHEVGKSVKFNELFGAVIKHKGDKFDPTQVNFEIKTKKFYKESQDEENGKKSMVPVGNGTGQMCYYTQKKSVNCKYDSFKSNKDIFDWDLSTLNKLKSGELNPPVVSKNDPKHRTVFQSSVFDDTPVIESPKKQNTSNNAFNGSGDILSWNSWKGSQSESKVQAETIKRRNPNQIFGEEREERRPVKINKMMVSSAENVLNTHA
jgi:hypothetical protein